MIGGRRFLIFFLILLNLKIKNLRSEIVVEESTTFFNFMVLASIFHTEFILGTQLYYTTYHTKTQFEKTNLHFPNRSSDPIQQIITPNN